MIYLEPYSESVFSTTTRKWHSSIHSQNHPFFPPRYHPLDEYRKSGNIYPSVSAILEKAPKGWGSVDFPTDKAGAIGAIGNR